MAANGKPPRHTRWTRPAGGERGRVRTRYQDQPRPSGAHPATSCDYEYTADEVEFMMAMDAFKMRTGRKFPTWSEALGVLKSLGYRKG